MSMKSGLLGVFYLCCMSVLQACGGGRSGDNGTEASGNSGPGLKTSHRAGEKCMDCHVVGGSAETAAIFSAAGTAFKSDGSVQTDATIKLYIHGTNTLAASIATDDSGNFYTSTPVDGLFTGNGAVTGVDVEAAGPGGSRNMPGLVTNGNCNSCHGDSVGRITVN